MQQEAFRIQKDMYIRIKDLELLDLQKIKIYEIMKQAGASRKIINNLLVEDLHRLTILNLDLKLKLEL